MNKLCIRIPNKLLQNLFHKRWDRLSGNGKIVISVFENSFMILNFLTAFKLLEELLDVLILEDIVANHLKCYPSPGLMLILSMARPTHSWEGSVVVNWRGRGRGGKRSLRRRKQLEE